MSITLDTKSTKRMVGLESNMTKYDDLMNASGNAWLLNDRRVSAARNILIVVLLLCSTGCRSAPRSIQFDDKKSIHVLVIPGILGRNPFEGGMAKQIERDLPCASVQYWDWTAEERPLWQRLWFLNGVDNLTTYARNQRRAAILAKALTEWRATHKTDTVYLVAGSAGTGIALFACEMLPKEIFFQRAVFISSAVSPQCDLEPVLSRTEDGLFSYYSEKDWYVLGIGTREHGCVDRICGDAAGHIGFVHLNDPRVREMAWTVDHRKYGNRGGHAGGFKPCFVHHFVVPLLDENSANDPPEWKSLQQ